MKKDEIWEIANNNPRADRQNIDWEGKEEGDRINNEKMLYDEKTKEDKRLELIKRIIRSYNKNVEKIGKAPKGSPLSRAEKRARKLEDLISRWSSWKNLS